MATMVITCESCGARFRLDSEKLGKPRNKVRCSKCKNIFIIEHPDENGLIHIEISDEESAFIPGTIHEEIGKAAAPAKREGWSLKKKILIAGAVAVLMLVIVAFVFGPGRSLLVSTSKSPSTGPAKPIVTITDSVQAYYLENVHSGQILVIRGEVLNESSQPVISVMVQGKLYKKDNTIAQIQQCYVRNSLTDKEIENLTVSEISEKVNRKGLTLDLSSLPDQTTKNQGQIPNSTVELVPVVHPAEKAPFMLVFHNLPEIGTLNNYSVNVISAKFDKELPSTTPPGNTTSHAMAPKSETSDFFDIPGIPGLKWGDSPAEARDVMDRCNARIINAYEDYNKRAEAHGKSGMGFHGKFMERDGEATLIFYEHKLYKCSIVFDVSESESAESFYSHLFRILEVKFGLPDKTEINNDRRYVQWYGDVINLYFYQSFFRDSLSNHKHVDIIEFSDWKTEKIADER